MQLLNRQFQKEPLKIQERLVAYATAEEMFLKRPPDFLGEKSLPKVNATAQQAILKGTSDFKEGLKSDATAERMFLKRPPHFFLRIVFSKSTQQAVSERSSEYSRWVVLKFSVATGQQIFENSLFNFSFGSSYTGYACYWGVSVAPQGHIAW